METSSIPLTEADKMLMSQMEESSAPASKIAEVLSKYTMGEFAKKPEELFTADKKDESEDMKSSLELVKEGTVILKQDKLFDEIYIKQK